jgi:glycosyltransferase involved in cell wall biosynthesis
LLFEKALKKTPYLLTLSHHMQHVFRTTCQVNPFVIYPPVNIPKQRPQRKNGKYYLIVSRLDRAKSIELAIEACNSLHEQLVIIGVSNDPAYDRFLHTIAGPTITFLGFLPNEHIQDYYMYAKAFLFTPKNEDFGIAPIEALSHGVPVIAHYGGGAKETMIQGKTGVFFYEHTKESLVSAMRAFRSFRFKGANLYAYAEKFSEEKFQKNLIRYLSQIAPKEVSL